MKNNDKERLRVNNEIVRKKYLNDHKEFLIALKDKKLDFEWWGKMLGFAKDDPYNKFIEVLVKNKLKEDELKKNDPSFDDEDRGLSPLTVYNELNPIADPIRRDFYTLFFVCIYPRYSGLLKEIDITIPVPDVILRHPSVNGVIVAPIHKDYIKKLLPRIWSSQHEQAMNVLSGEKPLIGRLRFMGKTKELAELMHGIIPEGISLKNNGVPKTSAMLNWVNSVFRINSPDGDETIKSSTFYDYY